MREKEHFFSGSGSEMLVWSRHAPARQGVCQGEGGTRYHHDVECVKGRETVCHHLPCNESEEGLCRAPVKGLTEDMGG